jgi:HD superfamily phosphodiesterase
VVYKQQGVSGGAHDWYHALAVAQYAALIAPDTELAFLGWVAGLLHEFPHRIFSRDQGMTLVRYYLREGTTFTPEDQQYVLDTILKHSGRDLPTDSILLMILRDADRLANIGAWHFLRAAQFRPDIPAVDPRYIAAQDPTATFKNPKSVLRDIEHTLEWESWLRLEKAKELGKPLFDDIRWLHRRLIEQFTVLGLFPIPDELVVTPTA